MEQNQKQSLVGPIALSVALTLTLILSGFGFGLSLWLAARVSDQGQALGQVITFLNGAAKQQAQPQAAPQSAPAPKPEPATVKEAKSE